MKRFLKLGRRLSASWNLNVELSLKRGPASSSRGVKVGFLTGGKMLSGWEARDSGDGFIC